METGSSLHQPPARNAHAVPCGRMISVKEKKEKKKFHGSLAMAVPE
jgi:hypothetical protein